MGCTRFGSGGSCAVPIQKGAKGGATMAVLRFFQGDQFGKGLADLRKIKQGIVTKTILAAGRVQNDAFGGGAKRPQGLTVTGCGEDTDETGGALQFWDLA